MMKRLWIIVLILPVLFITFPAFAQDAKDNGGKAPELQHTPPSCQEELVELQNMLHAANQTVESLMIENRTLQETIQKIRIELEKKGGYGSDLK